MVIEEKLDAFYSAICHPERSRRILFRVNRIKVHKIIIRKANENYY